MRYRLETLPSGNMAIWDMGAKPARAHVRPDYTPVEAQQVVDWLNSTDSPLPSINVNDWPGRQCQYPMRMSMEHFRQQMTKPWPMRRP